MAAYSEPIAYRCEDACETDDAQHEPYGQEALRILSAVAEQSATVAGFAADKLAPLIDQNTMLNSVPEEKYDEFWPQYFAEMRASIRRIASNLTDIHRTIGKVEL